MNRSLRVVVFTGSIAAISAAALYYFLPSERYNDAPWFPQVVVTLIGLVGASWFAFRRLELLEESNAQRKEAADERLAATEKGNLNGAIKEADAMMARSSLSSIIAGQRWLHHLAEDESLNPELIRSLLCAYIVSNNSASTSQEADANDALVNDESMKRTQQAALEMIFGSPGKDRYAHCKDTPELGSCNWDGLNFTDLNVEPANFREGNFTGAQISGTHFGGSDLRNTKWEGNFGGSIRTSMRGVNMKGVNASNCRFEKFDFIEARMDNTTHFIRCTFIDCDFTGASLDRAVLREPTFKECRGVTYKA